MKKLVTLLLVLTGFVCSASAKTFYVQNNCDGWDKLCLHVWGGTNPVTSWPGTDLLTTTTPVVKDGKTYYPVNIGDNTDFILSNGKESSTGNNERATWTASDIVDGAYYQFDYGGDGYDYDNKIKWYYLTKYGDYTFTVTTKDSWTNFYVYYYNTHTNTDIVGWTALKIDGTDNVYSFTGFLPTSMGIIFHNGSGSQTCDMFPVEGVNNYYVASIINSKQHDSWGETVKTNSSGFSTFVNTNPLTIPTGIAYGAEDDGDGTATAHAITNPVATTPMLIKGNANTIYHFATCAEGTSLSYSNAFVAGTGATVGSGDSSAGYNYILNGDTFYAANNRKVDAGKAYLHLTKNAPAGARVLVFEDEESTGIGATLNDKGEMTNDQPVYNLAGQRVGQPTKGLYIVNGKKVIIK